MIARWRTGLLLGVLLVARATWGEQTMGRLSVQLENPDPQTPVRVVLDERDLTPAARPEPPEPPSESWPPPEELGSFEFERGSRHRLVAEVPGITRAQILFAVERPHGWIVVHYHPGSPDRDPPPTLSFSLQEGPYRAK